VAVTLNNLAVSYTSQKRCAEAAPLYRRALAIFERALGPSDARVTACRANYAALPRPSCLGRSTHSR
jgi:hypothetical protein